MKRSFPILLILSFAFTAHAQDEVLPSYPGADPLLVRDTTTLILTFCPGKAQVKIYPDSLPLYTPGGLEKFLNEKGKNIDVNKTIIAATKGTEIRFFLPYWKILKKRKYKVKLWQLAPSYCQVSYRSL